MNLNKLIFNTRVTTIVAVFVMAAGLTACLDGDAPKVTPSAFVTLYHGSPNGPDLDVELDDDQISTGRFKYTDYTGYLPYRVGERTFKFGPYASINIDLEEEYTLEQGKFYSLFIAGEYEEAELIFINDVSNLPPVGKTRIRLINLSPDAGDINLKVVDAENNIVSNLAFKDYTDFIEVDNGVVSLEIRSAEDDELLVSAPDTNLISQNIYTIIYRGYVSPPEGNNNEDALQIVRN